MRFSSGSVKPKNADIGNPITKQGVVLATPQVLPEKEVKPLSFDLDKLARAVSVAETSGCTKGSAISRNNCFGIMQWDKKGNRSLRPFKSHADSFKEFKRIWSSFYKSFPDQALANKWVNGDMEKTTKETIDWLNTVKAHYYNS